MDHKDFDKIFSDKLKETQDFEFMESDWENVLGRIEVPEKQRRRAGWLWLLSLGFLMMAGTSLYLAISLKKTNQHLVDLKEALTESAVRVDTIVKEVRVVEYDTVVVFRSGSSNSIPPSAGRTYVPKTKDQSLKPSTDELSSSSLVNENIPKLPLTQNNQNSDRLNSTIKAINLTFVEAGTKTSTLLNADQATSNTVSDWRLSPLKSNSWTTAQTLLPKGAIEDVPVLTKVNKQKKLAWKNLSAGITGGVTLPKQLSLSESSGMDNSSASEEWVLDSGDLLSNRRNGFNAGLLLQYQAGKRWQLTGTVAYQQVNYELTEISFNSAIGARYDDYALNEFIQGGSSFSDEEDTTDITTVPPTSTNNDTIRLGNTTIKQKSIEYRLGANYMFRPDKKWRPFLGLSVSAVSLRQQELWGNFYGDGIDGEYLGRNSAADKISDLYIKPSTFRWDGVLLSTGFQLAINKRINWQMEAWYQQPFKTRSDQLYNLAGLRTGILFGF
jgi:hypothetical protein